MALLQEVTLRLEPTVTIKDLLRSFDYWPKGLFCKQWVGDARNIRIRIEECEKSSDTLSPTVGREFVKNRLADLRYGPTSGWRLANLMELLFLNDAKGRLQFDYVVIGEDHVLGYSTNVKKGDRQLQGELLDFLDAMFASRGISDIDVFALVEESEIERTGIISEQSLGVVCEHFFGNMPSI